MDALYSVLKKLGYEMSDEETQLYSMHVHGLNQPCFFHALFELRGSRIAAFGRPDFRLQPRKRRKIKYIFQEVENWKS